MKRTGMTAAVQTRRRRLRRRSRDTRWFSILSIVEGVAPQRFGNKQMHVFGHHHVADQLETIFVSDLTERAHKQIAGVCGTQEWQPSVTTEGDEMQVTLPVNAPEVFRHDRTAPRSQPERWGTRQNILRSEVARWYHTSVLAHDARFREEAGAPGRGRGVV